jgi:allophanate hydrolase subunit 2
MVDVAQLRATQAAANAGLPLGARADQPAVPATTVQVTNNYDETMWVEITGGTVTAVKIDTVTVGSRTSGLFLVRPGSTISITHSSAPTWQWFHV